MRRRLWPSLRAAPPRRLQRDGGPGAPQAEAARAAERAAGAADPLAGPSPSGKAMRILRRSNRTYDTARFAQPQIRIRHRKAKGKRSPCYVLRCGCCDEELEIHYSEDGLEIGGVNGAIDDWREILLPLLLIEERGRRLLTTARGKRRRACRQIAAATGAPRRP